jgi:molecular chaperone DnaK (HSP70)
MDSINTVYSHLRLFPRYFNMATVGIDFGSSYCSVGCWRAETGTYDLVANDQGNR